MADVLLVPKMLFGERLRALRKAAGMTQESLARASDVTVSAIRKLEQTDATPTWETAKALAKALGVTLNDLVEDGPEP